VPRSSRWPAIAPEMICVLDTCALVNMKKTELLKIEEQFGIFVELSNTSAPYLISRTGQRKQQLIGRRRSPSWPAPVKLHPALPPCQGSGRQRQALLPSCRPYRRSRSVAFHRG
jgi:hypothetical protein